MERLCDGKYEVVVEDGIKYVVVNIGKREKIRYYRKNDRDWYAADSFTYSGMSLEDSLERVVKRLKEQSKEYEEYWIKKYGENGKNMFEDMKKKEREDYEERVNNPRNVMYWTSRGYSLRDARANSSREVQKHNGVLSVEKWVNEGLTEEEAKKKISEIQKERSCLSPVHYMKKYGMSKEEADYEVSKTQSKLSSDYMKRTSREELRKHSVRCIEFYLEKGLSEEEAAEAVREFNDNTSVEAYKKRYGDCWEKEREKYLEKQRKANSGKNNGMWGKSPINGSGHGVSGYYNEDYFRSLYEYFFMRQCRLSGVTYICNDQSKKKWPGKIVIPLPDGRNYIPDFIVQDVIIEIKNEYTLKEFRRVKLPALQKYCIENNRRYGIYTEDQLDVDYMYAVQDFIKGNIVIDKKKIVMFIHTSWSSIPSTKWNLVKNKIREMTGIDTTGWTLNTWKDKLDDSKITYRN